MTDEQKKIEVTHSPETVAKVEQWLKNNKTDDEIAQAKNTPPAQEKISMPTDPVTSNPTPEEQLMKAALQGVEAEITDDDRDLYIKALLTDKPVKLNITLYGGNLTCTFRSRSMHEQERILQAVRRDIKDGLIAAEDSQLAYTRIQQYCVCLQLVKVNTDVFSELELNPANKIEQDIVLLRDAFVKLIGGMTHIRWLAILHGLATFENKCRKIAEECLNENFLKPRG